MRRRIITALALIFILFGIGSGIAVMNMTRTTASLRDLIGLHEIEDIRQDLNLSVQRLMAYAHAPAGHLSGNLEGVVRDMDNFRATIDRCQTCHHAPDIQRELEQTSAMGQEFERLLSLMLTTGEDSDWRLEKQKQTIQAGEEIIGRVQGMVNRAAINIRHRTDQAMNDIDRSYLLLLASFAATFIIAFFIAQYLTEQVSRPIEALDIAAKKITGGELGYQADFTATDDFARLIRSFNEMSRALAEKEAENKALTDSLQQKVRELGKAQKQLVEAEKMTALGTFAGGIAHDFNNILCGIISNIAILKQRETFDSSTIDTVEKACFRAATLIRHLLTFARQEVVATSPLTVNEHVTNAINLIRGSLPPNVEVRIDLADGLPPVTGDATRLEQVLLNLIINARDAMPDGGVMQISTTITTPDAEFRAAHPDAETGPHVTIRIRDTGIGMSEGVKSRIFEPFFTTKPFGQGTGLGLAMVHGIVRSHNGVCEVESTPGQGATFSIHLPAAREEGKTLG